MLILIFLVVSISLCVIRNAPKMLADAKSWKDKVREGSLRAFHHKAEFAVAGDRARATQTVAAFVAKAAIGMSCAKRAARRSSPRSAAR